jgi:hypothetical protein
MKLVIVETRRLRSQSTRRIVAAQIGKVPINTDLGGYGVYLGLVISRVSHITNSSQVLEKVLPLNESSGHHQNRNCRVHFSRRMKMKPASVLRFALTCFLCSAVFWPVTSAQKPTVVTDWNAELVKAKAAIQKEPQISVLAQPS